MKIFLIRDGKCAGPFQAGELRQKISNGGVSPEELAWGAGLAGWTNLEQVLAKADELSASGEADPIDQSGQTPPPLPEPSQREKSTKLRAASPSSSGENGQYDSPVQAVADAGEKQREAKRSGAVSSGRPNVLGFLRWVGVVAVVVFLLTAFMPWVRTSTTEFSAVKMILAKSSDVPLPGQNDPPKYFYLTKMILIGSLVLVLLAALISLSNILSRDAQTSGMGIMISLVVFVALVFVGVIYDRFFEQEFNDLFKAQFEAKQKTGITGGEPQSVVFTMDYGFYFSLAAVVLMAGCLMIPKIVFGRFGPAMVPVSVATLIAVGLGGFGVWHLDSRDALQEVSSGVKEVLPLPSADNKGNGSEVPE